MESKDNIYNYNSKDKEQYFNKDPSNQKFISDTIININNNDNHKLFGFYVSEKVKEKDSEIKGQLCKDKKKVESLSKNLNNKIVSIGKKSKQNVQEKIVIMEKTMKEKEGYLQQKEEVDLYLNGEEGKDITDNYIEDLNTKEEVQNFRNKNKKEISTKIVNFKSEENNKKINDYENDIEKNKKTANHNLTFSNDINIIYNNKNLDNSSISSFYYLTTKRLKEELEHDSSYFIDVNKSYNYIPKFNCKENSNRSNGQINNICKKNEIIQNENNNLNINQNIYFAMYNQMNIIKNNNEKYEENNSNIEKANVNEMNILNSCDKNINNSKDENIRESRQKNGKTNSDKENINDMQPLVPKNDCKKLYENEYEQTQKILYENSPNSNNNINFNSNNQRNENHIINNNMPNNNKNNNFYLNNEDLIFYNKFSNFSSNQTPSNVGINISKLNTNLNTEQLMIPHQSYDDLKLNMNDRIIHNKNAQHINFQNDTNNFKDNIQKNSNNINNINDNINLYNINYYKNYINLINPIIKQQNSKKDEVQNEIQSQINNILITNYVNNLNPDDYIIKMFNKLGWVCYHCNNFNFCTRKKCNQCQAIKLPKMKEEIFNQKDKKNSKKKKPRKLDWICLNCNNLNYGFRKNCNKCKIEKKEHFPFVYCEPFTIFNDNKSKIMLMNKFNNMQFSLDTNGINGYVNNFINNNINKNNAANYNYYTNIKNNILNKMNSLGIND